MSNNSVNDLKLVFNSDGTIDFDISPTGDISTTVTANMTEEESIRRNAIQIITFLILTPLGSILNANTGLPTKIGNEAAGKVDPDPDKQHSGMLGEPMDQLSVLVLRTYIQSSLLQATFIDSINAIDILQDRLTGVVSVVLDLNIIQDNLRITTTIPINV